MGQKLANQLPSTSKCFTDFSGKCKSTVSSFFFQPITPAEIRLEILSIPNNKSHGLYSCPTRLMKCASDVLSHLLAEIFNSSVLLETYPAKLKMSKIIPIFKADDETEPNNYRPISLLSNFNRIFEKLMYKRMKAFINEEDILYRSQYGFREEHSTQHAIIDIVNTIQSNMDKGLFSCGVFIDLKKAFDTVDHAILLDKLNHYGFRGIINNWFSSYLQNRTQTTLAGPHISERTLTTCGVPQGSVLGPLLFLLYINDIYTCSKVLNFYLFADDSNILYADKNLKSLEQKVNAELNKLYVWLTSNKLNLNIKKSNFVIFRPYQKSLSFQPKIRIFDNEKNMNISLDCKNYVKYLGILIDSNLSWKIHIEYIALKISKIVGLIAKLRHFVPLHTLLNIYQSLISPYITYGLSVWGQACKSHLNKILTLQKRALRFMYFAKKNEHTIPLFINAKLLPLNFLYYKTLSELMHDVSTASAPINICNLFTKTSRVHSYNTRSSTSDNFYIKASRLEIQKNAFSRIGAKLWNEIPSSLRGLPKKLFKLRIKNKLLSVLEDEDSYIEVGRIISKVN